MKRNFGFILIAVALFAGFLSVRGALPFIPIFGHSMDPTLKSGSLLTVKPIDPQDIEVGDIIVYGVPQMVRDYYNYPPTVAHRVIEVKTQPSLGFRTAGDNTGEDPFTIRPQDVKGTVGSQIPLLGLPQLFFQSPQGMVFVVIAMVLLALFLYGGDLKRSGNKVHHAIFAPVIAEEKRANRYLTSKLDETEKRMNSTENALEKFAEAVAEYAQHLASHTSAIQGLAEASHELKRGAAEQNRVLSTLLDNIDTIAKATNGTAPQAQAEAAIPETPKPEAKAPAKKDRQKPYHNGLNKRGIPGCTRNGSTHKKTDDKAEAQV